jgi:branched-chain amino acid aminotransferase
VVEWSITSDCKSDGFGLRGFESLPTHNKMKSFCYINGKILQFEKARVGASDIGILRGFGIYDGIKMYKGAPFRLDDHYRRFKNSAKFMGLKVTISRPELLKIILNLSKKFKSRNPNIKLILTGGPTINSIEFSNKAATFYVIAEESKSLPQEYYTEGCSLITHEHQRTYPEIKTINYITAVLLQRNRKKDKALEILYVSDGKVLECSTSNFFIVKNRVIITPKNNILLGITRKNIIEIAHEVGLKIEEREVTLAEMMGADEAFITSSYKEVVPVVKIDNKHIADGRPGEITGRIMVRFRKNNH